MTVGLAIVLILGALLLLTAGAYIYHCGAQHKAPLPNLSSLLRRERIEIGDGDETDELLPRKRV